MRDAIVFFTIIQLCKHVVAKVTLVPCSVNLTGKRDKVGHGEVTINNARIIYVSITKRGRYKNIMHKIFNIYEPKYST